MRRRRAVTRVVERTRAILESWELPDGWQTMPVRDLHDLCDANVAFDEAARWYVGGMDWIEYIGFLNRAQGVYDERYASHG